MNSHFRIMTYNIHKAIGGVDRKYDLNRVIEVIREANPAIAFLQEVDDNVPRSSFHRQVEMLAEALGFPHHADQKNVKVKQGGYGNAILSRFPIQQTWHVDLTLRMKKRRQALITVVQPDPPTSPSLLLCNTHLGLAGWERKVQVRRLLAHDSFKDRGDGDPVILGGDFNDVWSSLARTRMQPHRLSSASERVKTFPAALPVWALDGIYYRGGLNLLNCDALASSIAQRASDHLPLVADFQLAESDRGASAKSGLLLDRSQQSTDAD